LNAIDPLGVDTAGWFHAPVHQPIAPHYVITLLEDLEWAEALLRRGKIHTLKSLEEDHILFRADLTLADEDARRLGRDHIRVAIKPAATGLYGREYQRELAFYILGKHLGLRALIPLVERTIPLTPELSAHVNKMLTPIQRRKITLEGHLNHPLALHGTVQLWVEGYMPIIGYRSSGFSALRNLSGRLRRKHLTNLHADPMWQNLSDMFVLDFLIYNADRAREGGTIRLPKGGQRLILLDNGDTLLTPNPDVRAVRCRELFERVEIFSPNVIKGLQTLDEATVQRLLVDQQGKALAKRRHIKRIPRRAAEILKRIRTLERKARGRYPIRFPHPSRSMVTGR